VLWLVLAADERENASPKTQLAASPSVGTISPRYSDRTGNIQEAATLSQWRKSKKVAII